VVALVATVVGGLALRALIRPVHGSDVGSDLYGWTMQIPDGWEQLHPVPPDPGSPSVAYLANNIFVANAAASGIDDAPIAYPVGLVRRLPSDGVLMTIGSSSMGQNGDDYGYPATLGPAPLDPASKREVASFQVDGVRYFVDVTYGTATTALDRRAAADILGSMTVPSAPEPAEGTAVVQFPTGLDLSLWRLGPVDRFAPGSVTPVQVLPVAGTEQPASLFVVVSPTPDVAPARWAFRPPNLACDFTWTGTEFQCGDERWNARGQSVRRTADLYPMMVLETWEGQLIAAGDSEVSFPPA
jgi:hypothetical protein